MSFKLRHNAFCDHQTKADSLGVHLLRVLNETEQLEEFSLILLTYADPSILNRNLDFLVFNKHASLNDFDIYLNSAFTSEFDGVCLQCEKNLHDPLLITLNIWGEYTFLLRSFTLWNILILNLKTDSFCLSIKSLYLHNFFDGVPNIELGDVLPKFPRLNLGVIEEVFDQGTHEFQRRFLDCQTFPQFLNDFIDKRLRMLILDLDSF